jgi:hypothetical protein
VNFWEGTWPTIAATESSAFAIAIGGLLVGVVGIVSGWLNSKGAREDALALGDRSQTHAKGHVSST